MECDRTKRVNFHPVAGICTIQTTIGKLPDFLYYFVLTIVCFCSFNLYAQPTQSVTGTVVNLQGEPIPGVTVIMKGTTQGTISDVNGNYSLVNVSNSATLVFSFVGMETEEVPVAGKNRINITMKEKMVGIEEIVAIGYGTTTKKEVTGSVSSISSDDFIQGNMTSPLGAIQGEVAGLSIINSNGSDPTSDYTIRIRGLNSFSGGKSPLIIVDGAVWGGSLNMIDPEQIKTIDILKDGSAAAIYGTRATNGVILITLKKTGDG